jgi:hypothetical protein
MSHRAFIYLSAVAFIGLLTCYFLIVDTIAVPDRDIPYSYRQFAFEATKEFGNKVIVDSGSNSIPAIDAQVLSDYFEAPVLTIAANAGYPLRSKIFNLAKYAQAGDVVVIPLEWNLYTYPENYPKNFVDALSDKDLRLEYYFNNSPLYERIRFTFSNIPFNNVYKAVKAKRDLDRLKTFKRIAETGNSEAFGNSSINRRLETALDGSNTLTCDEYIFDNQREFGFVISKSFKQNLRLLQALKKRGVEVIFGWPATVDGPTSKCYSEHWVQDKIERYVRDISDLVRNAGFKFFGRVDDSHFDSSCFVNTYYHIQRKCAESRTNRLVSLLRNNGVNPLATGMGQEDLRMTILDSISRSNEYLSEKYFELLRAIGPSLVANKELTQSFLFGDGWSSQERWGVWSDGVESKLKIKLKPELLSKPALLLSFEGQYFNGKELTHVYVGEHSLGRHDLTSVSIEVPTRFINDQLLEIRLEHTAPVSPFKLGVGNDIRSLKYGLKSLAFSI